jgi:hypothetical protein
MQYFINQFIPIKLIKISNEHDNHEQVIQFNF